MQANALSYRLPAQLSAETADRVTEALCHLPVAPHCQLLLDASAVEQLTASGAQVLVSLHKSITAAQGQLTITDYPPSFSHALTDMGLGWLANPATV